MRLDKLKKAVDEKFGLDIATNSRQRNFTDAKKVFSKLAYETGVTLREIGEQINRSHCNILHHINSVDIISVEYKKKHDEIIQELDLVFSKPFFNIEPKKIKKIAKQKITTKTTKKWASKEIQDVIDILTGWDIETVEEFKQTRLDPFNALIKTRVKRKTIPEIKGATLNKKVKNPVLC